MKLNPLDFAQKTVTAKVTEAAWAHAHALSNETGAALYEVLSICITDMGVEEFQAKYIAHKAALDALPKSFKAMLRDWARMTPQARQMMLDLLNAT